MIGDGCVAAWTGIARLSMTAITEMMVAVAANITPESHMTMLDFASDTSAFVASVGRRVSNLVSSLVSRISMASPLDEGS